MEAVWILPIAYMLGSIPSAIWISRWFYNVDIRQVGSRNPGMTNVIRGLGWKPAVPVALIDAGKGWLACFIAYRLSELPWLPLLAGLVAVLGHSYTCLAAFKGGKGVLTAFGVFLFLTPWSALVALVAFALTVWATRYVSLGSILGALTLPLAIVAETRQAELGSRIGVLILATLVCTFVILRHRSNIKRLLSGTESRLGSKIS